MSLAMDAPGSASRATHPLDESSVPPMDSVSCCDKRKFYAPFPHQLLTVWVDRVSITTLPDDVLLHIFLFDRVVFFDGLKGVHRSRSSWSWHRLVHVCLRWRSVIFASPNFLNLKLVCGPRTRVGLTGIWPPLPIIIWSTDWPMPENYDFEAAIVHRSRVFRINLLITHSQLQRLVPAMQGQFPALTHLRLCFHGPYSSAPALTDGFLGGSAPHLQSLELNLIPFPALPKLLLSTTDLVRLTLKGIPHSGYISPEAVVTCLTLLANLKSLTIEFESLIFLPDWESRSPPPSTRIILPALTRFSFEGVSEYLEDLVARIDTPFLDSIWINFFHKLTIVIPQLAHFMRRTTRLHAFDFNETRVDFNIFGVRLDALPPTRTPNEKSVLIISCRELGSQIASVAQVFTSFIPSIYLVTHLYITGIGPLGMPSQQQTGFQNIQWFEIFHQFTAVENLYLSMALAPGIALALRELVGRRMTEVLPTLQNIFLEELQQSGPVQEAIGQFIARRQLLGHPVVVFDWNRN